VHLGHALAGAGAARGALQAGGLLAQGLQAFGIRRVTAVAVVHRLRGAAGIGLGVAAGIQPGRAQRGRPVRTSAVKPGAV
jgi:hypothetical protein